MSKIYPKSFLRRKNAAKSKLSGFTLIELFVVVLIIGILAAVALPQYQLAVLKSKYTQLIITGNVIRQAQDRFYMENGKYSIDFSQLDISFADCAPLSGFPGTCRSSNGYDCVIADGGDSEKSGTVYCSLHGQELFYFSSPVYGNKRYCAARQGYDQSKKLCLSIGGVYQKTTNNVDYFQLP